MNNIYIYICIHVYTVYILCVLLLNAQNITLLVKEFYGCTYKPLLRCNDLWEEVFFFVSLDILTLDQYNAMDYDIHR